MSSWKKLIRAFVVDVVAAVVVFIIALLCFPEAATFKYEILSYLIRITIDLPLPNNSNI